MAFDKAMLTFTLHSVTWQATVKVMMQLVAW